MSIDNQDLTPKVSIIIPVYNSEEYLYRCLDSVVYQSFNQIEVIIVNNGSTDGSLSILNQYESDFPNMVRVVTIPHAERAGAGRNVGISLARADYIVFSDSDDMMHPRAIENLYNCITAGGYDLVYAPHFRIRNSEVKLQRKRIYTSNKIKNDIALLDAEPSPWAKIFKKSLLLSSGDYPSDFSFEDLAYFFVYVTKAKRIGYCSNPVYYYFWRDDSEVHTRVNPRIAETILAEKYGVENCEVEYIDTVLYIISKRIVSNLSTRWIFSDRFLEHLRDLWPKLSTNSLIYKDLSLYNILVKYYLCSENLSPKNIFLNGFGHKYYSEEAIQKIKSAAYYDGCNVYILDESSCDISENINIEKSYECGDYNYVACYFAVKKIYEMGGVYLGRNIEIDLPLNYTRHLYAFFCYEGQNKFCQQIFGGKPGEPIFLDLIQCYQALNTSCKDFSEYVSVCLYVKYGITCSAKNQINNNRISTFTPDAIVFPAFSDMPDTQIHFCHYNLDHDLPSDLAVVPKEAIKWEAKLALERYHSRKNGSAQIELDKIKSSRSWKMVQWLKGKKGKGFGKIIYKIYLFIYYRVIKS